MTTTSDDLGSPSAPHVSQPPSFRRGLLMGTGAAVGLWAIYLIVSSLVFKQLMWDNTVVPMVGVLTLLACVVAVVRPRLRRAALGFAVALPPTALVTFAIISFVAIFFFGV